MSDTIPLSDIAHGRSGDKGNHANVAVIAYTPDGFAWLRAHLTADVVPGVLTPAGQPPEVVLRVSVHDERRAVVERFTKEFAPLVTSGPPGVTGYTTGRPAVREVFAYWPALLDKNAVTPRVEVLT